MNSAPTTFADLVRLGLLEIGDGYRAKNDELGGDGPIFLRAACLQDSGFTLIKPDRFLQRDASRFGSKLAALGDVVITTKGNSTGRVGLIREGQVGAIYSPHLSYWRSRNPDRIDQAYLYYWSQSGAFRHQLQGMAASTDMAPYLSLRDQLRLKVALPAIGVQRVAGDILGALDDKIDLNRRVNETLEAMARAIFQDWFVSFGPTRAKQEGRPPYLAPDLWSLFPNRLDDYGKPEGWIGGALLDLCQLKRGYDLPTSQRVTGPIPIISSSGVTDFHERAMVDGPGVVTGRYGTIGEVFFVEGAFWPLNTALYVRDFRGNSRRFVFYTLRLLDFGQYSDKGAVPGVNRNDLHRAPVTLPPPEVQRAFERILAPSWDRMAANDRETHTLASTRDLLLPKLMSGELRVRDAEAVVAEVA